jgi:hypothetical protein
LHVQQGAVILCEIAGCRIRKGSPAFACGPLIAGPGAVVYCIFPLILSGKLLMMPGIDLYMQIALLPSLIVDG